MKRRSFFTKLFGGVLAGVGTVLCRPTDNPLRYLVDQESILRSLRIRTMLSDSETMLADMRLASAMRSKQRDQIAIYHKSVTEDC